jgi:LuxR family maltose regulon positive regulatory protein
VITPFLKTKLYTPYPQPNLISRPRLLDQLEEGYRRKLTLISAPAGFGKTTLLSEWIANSEHDNTWLSLDKRDNDPTRFLAYLVLALQRIEEGIGAAILAGAQLPQPPPAETLLTELINEITEIPVPFVIVLDDFHVIDDQRIHSVVTFIIENLPPQMHLMIASRADPPLPIAWLRAQGQLTELRAAELRFTTGEVTMFLNEMLDFDLHLEDVEALEKRTEGWVVGLQLAALSMQGHADMRQFIQAFTGSHHYVVEYLTEEVTRRQPEVLQSFLLQTSILERLSGPICDAVTGKTGSGETLARMQRDNLFLTPLDDAHQWYRYHHLFAELLRTRLKQTIAPDEFCELHRRASQWYAKNDAVEDAIQHAIEAQDLELAASIIEASAKSVLFQGQLRTLMRWTELLPEERLGAHPQLYVYRAWALFLNGQIGPAAQMLQETRAKLDAQPPSPDKDALRGVVASMLATIATMGQEPSKTIEIAQEALTYLPEDDLASRARANSALGIAYGHLGDLEKLTQHCRQARDLALEAKNNFLAASIIEILATTRANQGRLRQAAQTYQELVDLGDKQKTTLFPPAGVGYYGLAGIYLEWNDLDSAERYLNLGMEQSRLGGIGYNLVLAYCTQVRLQHARGNIEGALAALKSAELANRSDKSLPATIYLAAHQVRFWLAHGDGDRAFRWAIGEHSPGEQAVVAGDALPIVLREVQQVYLALVKLAMGKLEEVLAIANAVRPRAQEEGRMARVIEIGLLEALALQAQGKTSAALEALASSLVLAEPEGYVRLYLDLGAPAYELLKAFYADSSEDPGTQRYAWKLLEAFANEYGESAPFQALVEPLTPRELEVLILITRGYSNQKIATHLVVTLHTVKKHTSNIYGKLDVTSRTQAVARGRELGLI